MERLAPTHAVDPNAWVSLLGADPQSSVRLHPELVATLKAAPLVFQLAGEGATTGLAGLAVLEPRRLPIARFARPHLALRGHRVLDDRLLGASEHLRVAEAFVDEVRGLLDRGGSDAVFFEDLDVSSPVAVALERAAAAGTLQVERPRPPQAHWWLDFPTPADTYWARFSAKTRNTFKRKLNKLPHEVTVVRAEADVDAFVAAAREISAKSWQGQRLGDRFAPHVHAELRTMARLGALRAYLLRAEGKPAAFFVGVQAGGRFVVEELGYDVDFRERGPGTVLMYRVLEDLIGRDTPTMLDFGHGHADYKALFGTRESSSGPLWVVAQRPRPQAMLWLARTLRTAEVQVTALLKSSGLHQRVRRLYRDGLRGLR